MASKDNGGARTFWERGEAMFHQGSSTIQIAGQVCIAAFFLVIGLRNLKRAENNVRKFAALGVPFPRAFLWAGFAFQFAGGLSVGLDVQAAFGACLLIVFTILANALFHRWWLLEDPVARRIHMNYFFNNVGNIGGLLVLIALRWSGLQ